jgi:hypothetical protein
MPWHNVNDSSGDAFRCFQQEKTQSCGVACTMMILKLIQNREIDEGTCRLQFTEAEGSINLVNTQYGLTRDFNAAGTEKSPIISVLSKYKVSANQVAKKYVGKWIKGARPQKPVILGVDWGVSGQGQGGHWVICAKYGTKLVCLDPYYGLVETLSNLFPFYFIDSSTRGKINDLIQVG